MTHLRTIILTALVFAIATPAVAETDDPEKEKWDVDGAHGGNISEVRFSVDEGTWLNVDVSPDGKLIVFDLLGDLYTLPIAGGSATRISSGRAMDMQPVFSPDGRHIAFTSDRAGGDNIWIINSDGSQPVQVSKEDFRLLNNPAWTPDGEYIVARKHFTSERSLGARELGMIVVMEGGSTFYHNLTMILDGATGIEHNLPIAPLYQDVIGLWKATDVRYTPTLIVSYGGISGEYYWYQNTPVFDALPLTGFVPRWDLDARARRRQMAPEEEYNHIEISKAVKKALDAGVAIQVGGHGQMQGLSVHWEMWSLAQGGMSNMEVLRAATLAGADYIGMSKDLGSIEIGKLADLVVLNSNPLEQIRHTETTSHVMANGRLYVTDSMNEIAPRQKARPTFWFERDDAQRAPASGAGMSYEHATTCHCGRH